MNKPLKVVSIFFLLLINSNVVLAEYALNMTKGVTELSGKIYDLHMMVFWVCVAIGACVFSAMIYSIFYHRKSLKVKPANFHENTKIELIWTFVPVLILIAMVIPATKTLINLEKLEKADLTIKITGYQWSWEYEYPEEEISFTSNLKASSGELIKASDSLQEEKYAEMRENLDKDSPYLLSVDNRLVLPANKTVRFLITSNDVIHSWWVPALGIKQDANPGFINDAWVKTSKIGTYRGQCTELCGTGHAFMPVVVDIVSEEDYDLWVIEKKEEIAIIQAAAESQWIEEDLIKKGESSYLVNCVACHGIKGEGGIGNKIQGSPIVNGDEDEHINIVLNGKNNMPHFKRLGDLELASIITYQRRAFGNNGSVVQPAKVKSSR